MLKDIEIDNLCRNENQINRENLMSLLRDNEHTKFGEKYEFSSIRNVNQFREKVPVSDYLTFQPYVEEMINGEKSILTVYPIANYVKTSGTEGREKYVPVSYEALKRYDNYIERYKNMIVSKNGGKRFWVNQFRTNLSNPIKKTQILSETYYRYLADTKQLQRESYVGGFDLLFQEKTSGGMYAKAWAALLETDITLFESVFLYDQLIFFQFLEKHWKELLDNMREKNIPEKYGVPLEMKQILLQMNLNKKRLDYVQAECEKGFAQIAQRLWTRLSLSSGIGNRENDIEDKELRKYLEGVPIHYFSYVASECHIGIVLEVEKSEFVLLPQSAFFEFIPLGESEKVLLPEELKIGEMYEVVITNFSGFYRYRLGDVIRVTGFYFETPKMEFVFRKNQVLNIAGEKMYSRQVEQAVAALNSKMHWNITQYSVGISKKEIPEKYVALFAGNIDETEIDENAIAHLLDEEFKKYNIDYADLRTMNYIAKPEAKLMESENYDEFMSQNGFRNGHNKPHHIVLRELGGELDVSGGKEK